MFQVSHETDTVRLPADVPALATTVLPPDARFVFGGARKYIARLQLVGRYKRRRIARFTLDCDFQVVRVYENVLAVLSPAQFNETLPSQIAL